MYEASYFCGNAVIFKKSYFKKFQVSNEVHKESLLTSPFLVNCFIMLCKIKLLHIPKYLAIFGKKSENIKVLKCFKEIC